MNELPNVPILLQWFVVVAAPILLTLEIRDFIRNKRGD